MTEIKVSFLGTGNGGSVLRANASMHMDCDDGTRFLVDAGSGNSPLIGGATLGIGVGDYNQILLSHSHIDHTSGLAFIAFKRIISGCTSVPLTVFGTETTLETAEQMCKSMLPILYFESDYARTPEGQDVLLWRSVEEGENIQLGTNTRATPFDVTHVAGAVGWRIESGEVAVVFSGDTEFSENLLDSQRLLIY